MALGRFTDPEKRAAHADMYRRAGEPYLEAASENTSGDGTMDRVVDSATYLLGIPGTVTQAGLLPVAHFTGEDFKPAACRPVEEITYWNAWKQTEAGA